MSFQTQTYNTLFEDHIFGDTEDHILFTTSENDLMSVSSVFADQAFDFMNTTSFFSGNSSGANNIPSSSILLTHINNSNEGAVPEALPAPEVAWKYGRCPDTNLPPKSLSFPIVPLCTSITDHSLSGVSPEVVQPINVDAEDIMSFEYIVHEEQQVPTLASTSETVSNELVKNTFETPIFYMTDDGTEGPVSPAPNLDFLGSVPISMHEDDNGADLLSQNEQEDEEDEDDGETEDYRDRSSRRASSSRTPPSNRMHHRHSNRTRRLHGVYRRRAPCTSPVIYVLSTRSNEILSEFRNRQSIDPVRNREKTLQDVKTHLQEHIRVAGSKVHAEVYTVKRQGDFLSRMKGCLRNAGLGLILLEYFRKSLDEEKLRAILACVPPLSTRPSASKAEAQMHAICERFNIPNCSVPEMDRMWKIHLNPEDLSFIRHECSHWPGYWDHLEL